MSEQPISEQIVFAPEVGAAVRALSSMSAQVVRSYNAAGGMHTDSVVVEVEPWVCVDGVIEPASKFPAALSLNMVCSADGAFRVPRRVIPAEYALDSDARLVAGQLVDRTAWQAFSGRMAAELSMFPVGVSAAGEQQSLESTFRLFDKRTREYRVIDSVNLSGSDTLSTRTSVWEATDGVGIVAAMTVNQDSAPSATTWLVGFSTPDPTQRFGLGVQLRGMNRLELVASDTQGSYVLAYRDLLREISDAVLVGLRYVADTSTASMVYVDDFTNSDLSARLTQLNGRPAGETLAGLDAAVMPTISDESASVFDVSVWTTKPPETEWERTAAAYMELYSIGVKEAF